LAQSETPGRRTLAGTIRVFAAEALIFPTGIVTAAFLTRRLGLEGYGLLGLTSMLVAWVEWSLGALFMRSTVRVIRHADEWKPLGTGILHLAVGVGLAATAALWLSAPFFARALDAPTLTSPLRLLALDVPLFALASAHRGILTARGAFGLRAWSVAARWLVRLALILIFVGLGLSVNGAILGMIGASVADLLVATRYDRPPLWSRPRLPDRVFLNYAIPLFGSASASRSAKEIDLFALKALGGTTADAGLYAAARNLAIVPSIFTGAFSPLLLATLTGLVRDGESDHARALARDALRLVFLLAPIAGIAAGAADEITRLVFGDPFAPAGPLMTLLVFAGLAAMFSGVATTVLVAGGRPRWPLWISLPILPLAVAGHLFAIPRWGAMGAASVALGITVTGAIATSAAVRRAWGLDGLLLTILRSGAVTALAWAAAAAWQTPGWLVVVKLAVLATAVPILLLALREVGPHEIAVARSLVPAWAQGGASKEESVGSD
jgi:O-antigen/teichoic acid export membrane protein